MSNYLRLAFLYRTFAMEAHMKLSPNQLAAFFAALPFLALACAWVIGLSFIVPPARKPAPVRVQRRRRPF